MSSRRSPSRTLRSPSLRADRVRLLGPQLAAAAVFTVIWYVMTHVAYYWNWLFGDVNLYENWGTLTAAHYLPYRDFPLEYPPGAIPIFISPIYLRKLAGYHETYYNWFRIELLVVGLLTIVVAAWALRMLGASSARMYAALLFIGAGPILLGPIALSRFDYFPALITVLAVALLLSGRERLACAVIGAGIVVKLYPAILLPIALVVLWRRYGRRGVLEGLGASLAVVAAGFLPFVVLAPRGLWHGIWRQVQRPPEVESFVSALWIGAHHVAGLRLHSVQSFGSSNIATPGVRLAGTLAGFLVIALVVTVWIRFARGSCDRDEIVLACAACVAAYVTFAKVLSPQYIVWLFPLVPLVRGRRGLSATVILGIAAVLTQLWEPQHHGDLYRHFAMRESVLVMTRDALLVAMLAVLMWPRPLERHAEQLDPARATAV
jgi:uncharacterized membrane protein